MRLIDADRLEREWNQHKTMIDNVDAQPTVDTIKRAHWVKSCQKQKRVLAMR